MNKKNKFSIVVIGAGEVGVTFALMLHEMMKNKDIENVRITLIDKNTSPQMGAKNAANVNHATGYEYLKKGHQQTGIDCIHGGITKSLFYPRSFADTKISNRFLISQETINLKIASYEDFKNNAEFMKEQYQKCFDYIKEARNWDEETTSLELGYSPQSFGIELSKSDVDEEKQGGIANVIGGYKSAGGTINMSLDYAAKKALLEEALYAQSVSLDLNNNILSVVKNHDRYLVKTVRGEEYSADMVLVTAAHGIPEISNTIQSPIKLKPPAGIYHLNCMLYIRLPKTVDKSLHEKLKNVNFVLQGDAGCMFACVKAPTESEDGIAAVYYPSEAGNQISKHFFDPDNPREVPDYWEEWISNGLPKDEREKRERFILAQLYKYNPFLQNYIEPINMVVRTVFNPVVGDNPMGDDRRVRQLTGLTKLTEDEKITCITSPKWTTVELTALSAVDHALKLSGFDALPTDEENGLGPLKFDVEKITRSINFKDITFPKSYADEYMIKMGFPKDIVPQKHNLFRNDYAECNKENGRKVILITGVAGFLGRHLCAKLLGEGYNIIGVDNFKTSTPEALKCFSENEKFKFFEESICKNNIHDLIEEQVNNICNHFDLSDRRLSKIYNLACPASPIHYQIDYLDTVNTCYMGTLKLLELAHKHNAMFFQASTSEVYGDPEIHPQHELVKGLVNIVGPRACYDEGKRIAETLCYIYQKQFNLDVRIARIFNTYGPGMSKNDGRAVPQFIQQCISNENITVFGTGKQTRSFCYVDDLIDGMCSLTRSDVRPNGSVNLGNSKEYTIKQLAEMILGITESKSKIVYRDLPQDDPVRRQPDITKAQKLLGWSPKIDLENGLRRMLSVID